MSPPRSMNWTARKFAGTISEMEAKLSEKDGWELDREIERLDHFKSIQNELSTTALH